jgi:hypothetical protein
MSTFGRIILALITILVLSGFQNCAPQDSVYTVYVRPQTNGLDPSKVRVSAAALATADPWSSATTVAPYAIDFGDYRLDLIKGSISYNSTRQIIRDLTANETAELNGILAGAILATSSEEVGALCDQTALDPYAILETDTGRFNLGSGTSPCAVIDAYTNDGSGRSAGLKAFLSGLVSN